MAARENEVVAADPNQHGRPIIAGGDELNALLLR